jgi:plastocyanin
MDRIQSRWRARGVLAAGRAAVVAAIAIGGAAVVSGGATTARAATMTVQVGQQNGGVAIADQFNATVITITQGDTVHWTWFSNPFGHAVVSFSQTGGVPDWQTPALLTGAGQSFDHMFNTAGVFTYYCSVHALRVDADPANIAASIALGKMVGQITVKAPPSVGGIAVSPDARTLGVAGPASDSGMWTLSVIAGLALIAVFTVGGASAWILVRRRTG